MAVTLTMDPPEPEGIRRTPESPRILRLEGSGNYPGSEVALASDRLDALQSDLLWLSHLDRLARISWQTVPLGVVVGHEVV